MQDTDWFWLPTAFVAWSGCRCPDGMALPPILPGTVGFVPVFTDRARAVAWAQAQPPFEQQVTVFCVRRTPWAWETSDASK